MDSCRECGQAVAPGASSCRYCGALLGPDQALDLSADALAGLPALDKIAVPSRDRATVRQTSASQASRTSTLSGRKASDTLSGRNSADTASGPAGATVTGKRKVAPGRKETADGLPDAVADPSAFYGRGMVLDDDPLNAFGGGVAAPALELDEGTHAAVDEEIDLGPAPVPESADQARRRQLAEIAQYGAPPGNILGAPAYWIRVMLRRRALDQELLTVAAQRKRADDGANDALVALGEALYGFRDDERLAKLRKVLSAIGEAEGRLGHVDAEGQKRKQSTNTELSRLERDVARLEKQAEPLREREAELAAQLAEIEGRLHKADMLRRKAESELDGLARKGGAADPELLAALRAERDVRHGDVQTIGVEMRPTQDDLAIVRKDLGKLLRQISVVQTEKQSSITALDRAQSHQRVSLGQAQSARQQAMVALANAAVRHKLLGLVPDEAAQAQEVRARAEEKKAQEELHRSAAASFDQDAYQRGMMILLGGSALGLLGFVIAILF